MSICAYVNCRRRKKYCRDMKLFRFPIKDKERLQKWILNSGNIMLLHMDDEKLRNRFLCDVHFDKSSFMNETKHRLIHTAVPLHHRTIDAIPSVSTSTATPETSVNTSPSSSPLKMKTPQKTYGTTSTHHMDTCDTRQSIDLQQQPEQQQHQQFADITDNEVDPVEAGNSGGFAQNVGATYMSSANGEQQCYLKWKFHHNNQQAMLSKLLEKESFCDVTIACEENILRAHKLMLSASSSYFEMILSRYEDQNPIIILKDVRYDDMSALLQFIYKGEVNVEQSQLSSLLETADMLKVKGLSEICRETRRLQNPLQEADIKPEEDDDARSTFAPATKTVQDTKRTRTTTIPEESFQGSGQPSSPIETTDLLKVEGLSDICGDSRRLEDPVQAMDIKIEEEEEDTSATFEPAKAAQLRRRTVPVPEESFHIPLKIPRLSTNTEITQNEPAPVSQSSLSSIPLSSAGSSVHIEGVIRLPEFLIGHGSYHSFWKKPWVVTALKAVSDREMTLRDCSDLLGVGYDVLYSRYRRVHGCLKEASVDSPGPSQDSAFRLLRTATVGDQEGNIIVRRDQLPPITTALSAVSHTERPANTSERENTLEPIINVKVEPSSSLSDQFESEIMEG